MPSSPLPARARETTRNDLANLIATAGIDRSRLKQSATAHARGIFNAGLIKIAEALGVTHFMSVVIRGDRATVSPAGMTAGHLNQIRLGLPNAQGINIGILADRVAATLGRPRPEVMLEAKRRAMSGGDGSAVGTRRALLRMLSSAEGIAPWPAVFDAANKGRRGTVGWASNLGLHHNSREFFLPIPPSLLDEARRWSAARRAA